MWYAAGQANRADFMPQVHPAPHKYERKGGETHPAGRVSRLVVEVDVVVCYFVQRHCADGAEKGQTRERGPRGLAHACFVLGSLTVPNRALFARQKVSKLFDVKKTFFSRVVIFGG